ncbi:MAG: hypothetical protein QM756_11850 [Polyangiaceae bacterium]
MVLPGAASIALALGSAARPLPQALQRAVYYGAAARVRAQR